MRLWQKVFLYTLILVMLAVSMTSILLLKNSFSLALEQRKQNVYSEHEFVITSFKSMMITERLRQNAVVLDEESLKRFMEDTFGGGQKKSGIQFCNDGGRQVYANKEMHIPQGLLEAVQDTGRNYMQVEGYQLYIASSESMEGKTYFVVTENDIADVVEVHENMLHQILAISMGCAMAIAFILLIVVKMLLHPLQKINEGTRAIAQGSYEKRIPERGHDELSELAHNMNRMARAVEQNVRALEDVAENRKHFIDNLSHEMKTPLTSILGFSDLLQIKRDISEESRMEYAGIIKEEASRMRTLSGKLMELITVGEANLEWKEADMAQLFEEIGISLKVITDNHHMGFSCVSAPGTLCVDRELFKSLLYNLVDNAVKASEEGAHIQVEGHFEREEFCIRVTDEGVGIPEGEVEKITEAFYMVDKARGRASGGAGLGLALCSEIISLHQGSLQFESRLGEGTSVLIRMKGGKCHA
ncbi:MAG: HAMP domain-containing histidine kinase [Lachnospiraceae bacterium]|nr:HAMP domain-containing histidine kinase [Lachnospiraceae bacterium]